MATLSFASHSLFVIPFSIVIVQLVRALQAHGLVLQFSRHLRYGILQQQYFVNLLLKD